MDIEMRGFYALIMMAGHGLLGKGKGLFFVSAWPLILAGVALGYKPTRVL